MLVQTAGPLMRRIADDRAVGVVVGADKELPPDLRTDSHVDVAGQRLFTVAPASTSTAFANQLKLADLLHDVTDAAFRKVLRADLPDAADTLLSLEGALLAGAEFWHEVTKGDAQPPDIAITGMAAVKEVAGVLSPLAPWIDKYKPFIGGLVLVFKAVNDSGPQQDPILAALTMSEARHILQPADPTA